MALAPAVDAHGFTRCEGCGTRFKNTHACRRRNWLAGAPALRRPANFDELVAEGRAEARAAAIEQPTLLELDPPCSVCGGSEAALVPETDVCVPCTSRAALAAAGLGEGPPGRSP